MLTSIGLCAVFVFRLEESERENGSRGSFSSFSWPPLVYILRKKKGKKKKTMITMTMMMRLYTTKCIDDYDDDDDARFLFTEDALTIDNDEASVR